MTKFLIERRPLDQFHHQRADITGVFEAVDLRNVGMIQRREHLRFATEARKAIGIVRDGSQQDLIATSRFSFVSRAQ